MRKFMHFASTAVVAVSLFGGVAAADTSCNGSISTTGTGSTNTVNCVDTNNNTVNCSNNVVVNSSNSQSSTTGSASNSGNTSSGNATSGNASNSNTAVVSVGASCAPVGSTGDFTVTTTPPTTPATPATSTPQVKSQQVAVKPVGAVAAGGGAGTSMDRTGLVAGVTASLIAVGAGVSLALRKRSQI